MYSRIQPPTSNYSKRPSATTPAVFSAMSFALDTAGGTNKDIVGNIATNIIALDNQKHRERSFDEQSLRSGIGALGSTIGLVNPVAGTVIGATLLGAEVLEMDLHGQRKMNNIITNNIVGNATDKEKKAREELARDIVFDRCL